MKHLSGSHHYPWRLPAFADLSTSGPPPIPARPSAPPPVPAPNVRPGMPTFGILAIIGGVGIVCVITFGIVMAAIMAPAFIQARDMALSSSCQSNLKMVDIICRMYKGENEGQYPPLTTEPGCFAMEPSAVYPEYLYDLSTLVCSSDEWSPADYSAENAQKILNHNSYIYPGYALLNEKEGQAFIEVCRTRFTVGGALSGEVSVPEGAGSGGGKLFLPLAEDIAARLPQTAAGMAVSPADIPVMMDKYVHQSEDKPDGICVLYMDGHAEFIRMGEKWPADQDFLDAIVQLETQYAPVEEE